MLTKATDDLIKDFSKVAGELLAYFAIACFRAWLVSVCATLFFPDFVLGFWNWVLVVITFRLIILPNKDS
jgi:hypothetical protein